MVVSLVPWVFALFCLMSVWLLVQAGSSTNARAHGMGVLVIFVGLLTALLAAAIVTVPFWIIFKRAGTQPALSMLIVVPLLNLAVLYWVALSKPKLSPTKEF